MAAIDKDTINVVFKLSREKRKTDEHFSAIWQRPRLAFFFSHFFFFWHLDTYGLQPKLAK